MYGFLEEVERKVNADTVTADVLFLSRIVGKG
jgi:hypothetical protein